MLLLLSAAGCRIPQSRLKQAAEFRSKLQLSVEREQSAKKQ